MQDFAPYYRDHVSDIVDLTTALANFETPTSSKPHVDQLGGFIEGQLRDLGAQVHREPREQVGDILLAKWNAESPGKPILFMMHMDTVWPLGTLADRPVHVEGERLIGPGTYDMKASIALVLTTIRTLQKFSAFPDRPIWALFTSDEETGSTHSWDYIEQTARQVGLALVMEFAAKDEGLKTWRKGIGHYTVEVRGKASHAGNAPEKGINAVVELAHQTLRLTELNALDKGTSVSVTVCNGGTATNVIPDHATGKVDVRFTTRSEAERVANAINALQPVLPGATISTAINSSRPPMERDATMIACYEQAKAIAARYGMNLPEDGSGGGSDGNITAAMGVPTLDGLGSHGEGAHAVTEQCLIPSMARRAVLLSAMMREWEF
jgi:glutamate carboxypeptidase